MQPKCYDVLKGSQCCHRSPYGKCTILDDTNFRGRDCLFCQTDVELSSSRQKAIQRLRETGQEEKIFYEMYCRDHRPDLLMKKGDSDG